MAAPFGRWPPPKKKVYKWEMVLCAEGGEVRFIFVYPAVRGKGILGVGRELGAEG